MRRSEKKVAKTTSKCCKHKRRIDNKKALIEFDQVHNIKKSSAAAEFCIDFIYTAKKNYFFTRRWTFLEHYIVWHFSIEISRDIFFGSLLVVYKCIKKRYRAVYGIYLFLFAGVDLNFKAILRGI